MSGFGRTQTGTEDGAGIESVCGERSPEVLGKEVGSMAFQLLPCPALLEAANWGSSAGSGRPQPVSSQLLVEGEIWMAMYGEMKYYPEAECYFGAPCFPPGSDEPWLDEGA